MGSAHQTTMMVIFIKFIKQHWSCLSDFFSVGPCTGKDGVDPDRCDGNGYYKPRYCWRLSPTSEQVLCACFYPIDGSLVDDSMVIAPADKDDIESAKIVPVDTITDSVPVVDKKPICKDKGTAKNGAKM